MMALQAGETQPVQDQFILPFTEELLKADREVIGQPSASSVRSLETGQRRQPAPRLTRGGQFRRLAALLSADQKNDPREGGPKDCLEQSP